MKINKTAVVSSILGLSKSTTNKFWGALAIIKSIDGPIQPNKTYIVNSSSIMTFLDKLFNLNSLENNDYNDSILYVKFSTIWQERLEALTLKNKPNLIDAAIFYSKLKEYKNQINTAQIKDDFLNDCKIRTNALGNLFIENKNENIELETYDISDLIKVLESKLGTIRNEDYHLSLESPFFIQSKPSELKRAPFIQTLYSGDRIKELLLLSDSNLEELYPNVEYHLEVINDGRRLHDFIETIEKLGLKYEKTLISRFIASLLTKPFVILTGLSGSGKTKLAQAFVQWICQDKSQYRIIPVGADWTNREPLLGYPNALKPEEYVKPDSGVLDLIIQANKRPELPHFLILDEMNLSHVERYFADFLSVMESKEEIPLYAESNIENGVPAKLKVPANLFIIGTVNIDETTNMFSPKVLDRANTIEFRVTQSEMENFLGNIKDINMDALTGKGVGIAKSFLDIASNKLFVAKDIEEINTVLVQFFVELKKTGAEFGYRSATEILRLIHQLAVLDKNLTTNQKIDIAIMQKLLPKLHGSRRKLCPVLETLGSFCISDDVKIVKDIFEKSDFNFNELNVRYPISLEKISRMYRGAIDNGFASFAEA